MIFFGIDPGRHGALAAITDTGELVSVIDLPYITDGKLAWVDSPELMSAFIEARQGRPARIYAERVNSMPGQGVASSFAFGVGFGSLLAACRHIAMPLEFVRPTVWKGALGLTRDKHASLDKARLIFPTAELHLAKHEGRSEALLIAEFGRRTFTQRAAG